MKRPCIFVVGEKEEVAAELGLMTLPKPVGDPVEDIRRAVEAIRKCRKAKIVIKGGTPYEAIIAAAAAYIEYTRTELVTLHNPEPLQVETALIHALGTGETYKIRQKIMELLSQTECAPIETIADILGQTPATIERHARLMKPAGLITITKDKICLNEQERTKKR